MTDNETSKQVVLRGHDLSKIYGSNYAIRSVNFDLRAGEIHALIGENGAGKSTLSKIIAGAVQPSEGYIELNGQKVEFANPKAALDAGVAMVYQETGLVPTMTVAQNIQLGVESRFIRLRTLNKVIQAHLQSMNFNVDPTALGGSLSAAQRQMVEIARAVYHKARVIIFDEPTATLTPSEKKHFFNLIRELRSGGTAIIYISHALEEVEKTSDRVTIMRDGEHIKTDRTDSFTRDEIVRLMVGRESSFVPVKERKERDTSVPAEPALTVENVTMGTVVKNMSFSITKGEVTALFGLVGSGRTEIAQIISGALKRRYIGGGRILLGDKLVRYRVPTQGVGDGIACITEDRKLNGYFDTMSITDNIYAGFLACRQGRAPLIDRRKANRMSKDWTDRLSIRAISGDARVVELSGGNQQKVVIAKSLVQDPKVVIFDEPTHGVDVGAIPEIHKFIRELADTGVAVLVISSYIPEVMSLGDRILVARRGQVVEEFSAEEATQDKILYAALF
jgi:ABC-type sugar transport system ATPase subunit